ncbi:MAG: Fe-S cluster assembly protein SufD [Burkholderiales bacterium]|nr:Fe-S cluster assembly protein SufD [Burkholderiales bacterium]
MSTATAPFLEHLLAGQKIVAAEPAAWVNRLRAEALECAHQLALPTTRDEDWRFTDLSPLYRLAFRPAAAAARLDAAALAPFAVPEAAHRLVFVDGHFSAALSTPPAAGSAVAALPLAAALGPHGEVVHARLARIAEFREHAFRAVNTAYLHDGAFVLAPRNHGEAAPLHLLFVATQADATAQPRVLVVAEPGADLTVIEDYVSTHDGAHYTNAVTEIDVGANGRVRHVRLQRESRAAFHTATAAVRLDRDASYHAVSVAVGARISRLDHHVVHAAEGTFCSLDGLALLGGRQLADTHSFVDHAVPNTGGRQLHKTVVADGARAVFNGRVLVRPGAQGTNSAQESRNLLLSDRAQVDTKPQLEIFADDVKCSHGATVGQLEAEELFYLESRGIGGEAARNLLTYGFAAEIVGHIPVPSLVRALRETVLARTGAKE